MFATRTIITSVKPNIMYPLQRLYISIKFYSSSDSSSDSDSDVDKSKKQMQPKKNKKNENNEDSVKLQNILNDMIKGIKPVSKRMDVAMPRREEKIKTKVSNIRNQSNLQHEMELRKAAEKIAAILKNSNKEKVVSQLLDRLPKENAKSVRQKENTTSAYLNSLVTNLKTEKLPSEVKHKRKENIITNTNKILSVSDSTQMKMDPFGQSKAKNSARIFIKMKTPATNVPTLSTWNKCKQMELESLLLRAPENPYQELIQWTKSGKLWKFPIDNEQGMEEEHNIHFSEHVFLERHLKDWCPKKGPIRHYMELVCVGLSKNCYLTVDEKKNHIAWYKEYFLGKTELLKEIGAIEEESVKGNQIET